MQESIVLPEFLTVFLNTQFGIGQIRRRAMRSINQANVSGSEVRKILIPIVSKKNQEEVAGLINNSIAAIRKSSANYVQATTNLESELGLNKIQFNKPTGFVAKFSELEDSHRSDAQHFQPRFTQLFKHLNNFPTKRIREIQCYNRRGLQPEYVKNGTINVVNSQHLSPKHIDYAGLEKTSPTQFALAPVAHISRDDLLIYTTGAYIGRTNIYLSDEQALASNHVNILRMADGIDAAYMSLVFQSVVGQFQTQKHARGSAQAELYPADIDKFIVPLLPIKKQEAIGDLLRESLVKQQESARHLAAAKARVEQLIEEAVAK